MPYISTNCPLVEGFFFFTFCLCKEKDKNQLRSLSAPLPSSTLSSFSGIQVHFKEHHPLYYCEEHKPISNKMGDKAQAVVVDTGSDMCKAGFAGDDAPR